MSSPIRQYSPLSRATIHQTVSEFLGLGPKSCPVPYLTSAVSSTGYPTYPGWRLPLSSGILDTVELSGVEAKRLRISYRSPEGSIVYATSSVSRLSLRHHCHPAV